MQLIPLEKIHFSRDSVRKAIRSTIRQIIHCFVTVFISLALMVKICCGSIYLWLKLFPFVLNSLSYITIPKQREIKFKPRIKLDHNKYP